MGLLRILLLLVVAAALVWVLLRYYQRGQEVDVEPTALDQVVEETLGAAANEGEAVEEFAGDAANEADALADDAAALVEEALDATPADGLTPETVEDESQVEPPADAESDNQETSEEDPPGDRRNAA